MDSDSDLSNTGAILIMAFANLLLYSFTQVSLLRFLLPMLGRDQLGKINKSEFLCE